MRLLLLISVILLGVTSSQASSPDVIKEYIRYTERVNSNTSSLSQSGFSIQCNDISSNGIGSAYKSYVFSLVTGDEKVDNYRWKFLLRNNLGDYVQITDGTDETFSIPALQSPEQNFVNINGDLEGRIECEYTLNGEQCNAIPFTLSLELKPTIISISDITIVDNGQYEFSLDFDVHYAGADYVSVEIEEENNTILRNYRFDEPFLAHIKTGNITKLYYSWVTVIVSNKYGSVSETLEYAPTYEGNKEEAGSKYVSSDDIFDYNNIKEITIFTLDGIPMFKGSHADFMNHSFTPGLYIKEEVFSNGYTKTSKIHLM